LKLRSLIFINFLLLFTIHALAQSGPGLILTEQGIKEIRAGLGKAPLFDQTLEQVRQEVELAMQQPIEVPLPKDLAGGYTHEQHKNNFFLLQKAGLLYQITNDEKFAVFVRDMLMDYKNLYPELSTHPDKRSYAPGKLFWQCLNDANWLVYVSQAYDCIYSWLNLKEREALDNELFRPMADFLSLENPQFFNRIHNHSTWGNAAVGMIGLVMNDKELIDRALYGVKNAGLNESTLDNDGGLIMQENQKDMGFIAQIDHAFSPDGYYTEGPYYQRYAMYPFLIFAQALHNKKPELEIFEYRKGVLLKGVYALLNQTNAAGEFFPINDAQKGMSYKSRELTTAVNIAYYYGSEDASLLSIVQEQAIVSLDQTGMATALAIAEGKAKPFHKNSVELSDGADGNEGALGILRAGNGAHEMSLVMKYTKHGMGHGHFDKLSFCFYNGDDEVIQDYGAARWVNIEQKDGGGYLKENNSWAKHTIAHNTVVINGKSQFNANVKRADQHHPEPYLFSVSNGVQLMSAKDVHSYEGTTLHRTMALIEDEAFEKPLVLDVFKIIGGEEQKLDLPFYYQGELLEASFEIQNEKNLLPLGDDHAYQHLWKEAKATPQSPFAQLNWMEQYTFYTLSSVLSQGDETIFARLGANDPNFNLRRDPAFIIRRHAKETLFVSILETHGSYSPVDERPLNPRSQIEKLEVLLANEAYTLLKISIKEKGDWLFALSMKNAEEKATHQIEVGEEQLNWRGPYQLIKKF